jgi:Tfp pilus assembly protein PilN
LGLLFIPNFGFIPINSHITQLDKDIAKAEEDLKKVQEYRKRLDDIKKLNKSIEEKLKIIEDIEKKRTGPVWLLDELTDAVSRFKILDTKTGKEISRYYDDKEMKIFLSRFEVVGSQMSIEGMALNNTFLVAFLNNLKAKNYLFNNVILYFSDQTSFQGSLVRSFRITADVILIAKPGEVTTSASAPGQAPTGAASNVPPGTPANPTTPAAPAAPSGTPTSQAPKPK